MSIAQRIRRALLFVLFATAYITGMKILFSLSTVAPFITTLVLAAAAGVAWPKMKRAAVRTGSKPINPADADLSLADILKAITGLMVVLAACIVAAEISAGAVLAVVETAVFGFMLFIIFALESARVEISTRRSLGLA